MSLTGPMLDPAPMFDLYRGRLSTEILCAVACRTPFFASLGTQGLTAEDLTRRLGWTERAVSVVTTALRAMNFLEKVDDGRFRATQSARLFLEPDSEFRLTDYLGLSANSPAVTAFLDAIERPAPEAATETGTAFTFRSDKPSAMDDPETARFLTMSLAGRGRCVAPALVRTAPPRPHETTLLDIGGGSGWYSIAYLAAYPQMRAVVWDRPEVLAVARENAESVGVADRLECVGGDMFADPFPVKPDCLLVSNILHDWDAPEIHRLLTHWRQQSRAETRLILHDVYLNDSLDGPLPIALYSADLFLLTEGRAYSRAEYLGFFSRSGWCSDIHQIPRPTLAHCGVMEAIK
jgi:3-hydroxy-5-methyl-1-naphthoate 3-O-methyltransferase